MTQDQVEDALLDLDWKHVRMDLPFGVVECEVAEFSSGDSVYYEDEPFDRPKGLMIFMSRAGQRRAFHVPFRDIRRIAQG